MTLTNNTFFRNWAAFPLPPTADTPPPTVDEKSMYLLGELGFKKVEGNAVADANFDIDPAFYAAWHARTSQLRDRFSQVEWKDIARPWSRRREALREGMAMDWQGRL